MLACTDQYNDDVLCVEYSYSYSQAHIGHFVYESSAQEDILQDHWSWKKVLHVD